MNYECSHECPLGTFHNDCQAKCAKSRDVSKEFFTLRGSVPPAGRSSSGLVTPVETSVPATSLCSR